MTAYAPKHWVKVLSPCEYQAVPVPSRLLDRRSSTTLLVSSGTEGFDLLGVEQPEDEILEQPKQHLPMHAR
jgi:hypothetical protein